MKSLIIPPNRRIWLYLGIILIILPAILILLFAFSLFGAGETRGSLIFGYFALCLTAGSVWLMFSRSSIIRWVIGLIAIGTGSMSMYYIALEEYHSSFTSVKATDFSPHEYNPDSKRNKLARLNSPSTLSLNETEAPRLDGATALYPLYASFAFHTYPKSLLQSNSRLPRQHVHVGKTPEAYRALNEGETDIIFVAGPSDAQRLRAAEAGVDLHLTPIGREAFVFYVAKDNPIKSLTQDQIRSIYSGQIKNWKSLGGKNRSILAFQRNQGSGSQTMFTKIMGTVPVMPEQRETVSGDMFGVINQTADFRNYPGAIGYSFRVYVSNILEGGGVHLLAVDGIEPTPQSIADGTYPFSTEFYAVTNGPPKPNEQRFIDWIRSAEGRQLISATGYVPLSSHEPLTQAP